MASLTRWTWVWLNSGSWWWTGRPGVLWFMGSQRVGHNWATELMILLEKQKKQNKTKQQPNKSYVIKHTFFNVGKGAEFAPVNTVGRNGCCCWSLHTLACCKQILILQSNTFLKEKKLIQLTTASINRISHPDTLGRFSKPILMSPKGFHPQDALDQI